MRGLSHGETHFGKITANKSNYLCNYICSHSLLYSLFAMYAHHSVELLDICFDYTMPNCIYFAFTAVSLWVIICNQCSVPLCLAVFDALLFFSSAQWGVISSLEISSFLSTSNRKMLSLQELIPYKPVSGFYSSMYSLLQLIDTSKPPTAPERQQPGLLLSSTL